MTAFAQRTEGMDSPWWLVLLEGIAAVIIGLFLLTAPGATLFVLVQVLGIFWLVGGIFRTVSIFIDTSLWGWKLVGGVLGILAGIVVLQHPLWSSVLVPAIYLIILGIQGLISGGVSLVLAFSGGGWGAGILGALSIVFGLVLLFNVWSVVGQALETRRRKAGGRRDRCKRDPYGRPRQPAHGGAKRDSLEAERARE